MLFDHLFSVDISFSIHDTSTTDARTHQHTTRWISGKATANSETPHVTISSQTRLERMLERQKQQNQKKGYGELWIIEPGKAKAYSGKKEDRTTKSQT